MIAKERKSVSINLETEDGWKNAKQKMVYVV